MLTRLAQSIAPTAPPLLALSLTASASTVRRASTRQVSLALRLAVLIIVTGLIMGLVGRAHTLLLHRAEMTAWDRHEDTPLHVIEATPAFYRLTILSLTGLMGAASWTLMFRKSRQLVSVSAVVSGEHMSPLRASWHTPTQIVLVAMGTPIGYEVASREMSVAFSAWACNHPDLNAEDRRTIIACGTSAGLAAVYSIPLSGVVYTLEILLAAMRARTIAPAFAINALAVLVSTGWNRPEPFHTVSGLHVSASLSYWAPLFGPIPGWLGVAFRRYAHTFEDAKPRNLSLWWTLPLAFTGVGIVSMFISSVLGNGQASAQTQFEAARFGGFGLASTTLVLLAKIMTTLVTIRVGGWGGTFTPGLALGAGLGAVTGPLRSQIRPGTSTTTFVFIGAAVFFGTSMEAPLMGLVLLMEFTHQGSETLVPMILAIGGAVAATAWAERAHTETGQGDKGDSPQTKRKKTRSASPELSARHRAVPDLRP